MQTTKRVIPAASTGVTKQGEDKDCVVRAITNVTGLPYDEVHAVLKKHGRKDRHGTYYQTSLAAMKELGFVGIPTTQDYWARNLKSAVAGKRSLNQVLKDLPMGKFVVYVRGHATALVNGKIIDTFDQSKQKPVKVIWYHPAISFAV